MAFLRLSRALGHVAHVLLRRSPLGVAPSFDLHVLGTPPAFVLSHDQTLRRNFDLTPNDKGVIDLFVFASPTKGTTRSTALLRRSLSARRISGSSPGRPRTPPKSKSASELSLNVIPLYDFQGARQDSPLSLSLD